MNVSASKVNDLTQCSYSFYLKHVEKLPDRPHPRTLIGSFIHNVIEAVLLPRRRDLLLDILNKGFSFADFSSIKRYGIMYRDKYRINIWDFDEIESMIKLAFDTVKVDVENGAFESENRFELDIDGAKCTGYIDIVSKARKRIIDFKSRGKRFTAKELANSLQGLIYQMSIYQETGELWPVDFIMLRFPPTKRKATYHIQTVPPPNIAQIAGLKYYVKHIFNVINNFGLKDAHSSFCKDQGFCERVCPFMRPFRYLHVKTRQGEFVGNYFLDAKRDLKENEVGEIRRFVGCPLYNKE